jgi:hypothetical protein
LPERFVDLSTHSFDIVLGLWPRQVRFHLKDEQGFTDDNK